MVLDFVWCLFKQLQVFRGGASSSWPVGSRSGTRTGEDMLIAFVLTFIHAYTRDLIYMTLHRWKKKKLLEFWCARKVQKLVLLFFGNSIAVAAFLGQISGHIANTDTEQLYYIYICVFALFASDFLLDLLWLLSVGFGLYMWLNLFSSYVLCSSVSMLESWNSILISDFK